MPSALISGVCGQDGAYLTELLLSKGYDVTGIARHASERNTWRVDRYVREFPDRFRIAWGDVLDFGFVARCIDRAEPTEVYNLAAQSDVAASFETPDYTMQVNTLGTARLLEALRVTGCAARFYQASTSELFGDAPAPQNEETPFRPMSPYAASKVAAFWMVRTYRDGYGMHASNGILFNHESPLRAECFVSRKIAKHIALVKDALNGRMRPPVLKLGNLDAKRDWSHARDVVEGMWRMVQLEQPGDYVLASGEARTVRQFLQTAYAQIGIRLAWAETGDVGFDADIGYRLVESVSEFRRPLDVPHLCGDYTKARLAFGWQPKTSFKRLVQEMIDAELAKLRTG